MNDKLFDLYGYTWDEAPKHLKNALSTTEKKGSWTVEGVMAEYDETGKLSRRKKAFMKEVYLTAVKEKQIEFDREFYNYLGDIR